MASPDSSSYNKLVDKLRELFELDKADLDFGIYRIIGQRQDQIDDFLRNQLKKSVAEVLSGAASIQQTELETALAKAKQSALDVGVDPEEAPKVKELLERLAALGSSHRVEHEVYEHLYRFFSRYYEEGDFISQRRVSRNARYAIPYNGEEVKLHWANADQYYIKSSENFRDYRFKLPDGRGVHFKLLDADTNRDNTKGDKRFFRLAEDTLVSENESELLIHFNYGTFDEKKITDVDGKEKTPVQSVFNGLNLLAITKQLPDAWSESLRSLQATKANPKRTLLERHLNDYTAKNSFDYFIHKDLGGFLRQELDFYIKNEVMFLDDIEDAEAPQVESYLQSLKAIRRVAGKVIDFLAQLENFQKKLWLKKKFVVQCDYCITLDRVPKELYPEIAANEGQVAEWRKWGFFEADTDVNAAYLQLHPYLVFDTKYCSVNFKMTLLAAIDDIDEQCNGILVNADNFQALSLLSERYNDKVKCIYVDPPYNTGNDGFIYRDSYQHSSWMSLMDSRIRAGANLLSAEGSNYISLDEVEISRLRNLLGEIYGDKNLLAQIVWKKRSTPPNDKIIGSQHEYIIAYCKDSNAVEVNLRKRSDKQLSRYENKGGHPKGSWAPGDLMANVKGGRYVASLYYPIINPVTGAEHYPSSNGNWRFNKQKIERLIASDEIWFGDDNNGRPKLKRFLCDVKDGISYTTLWDFVPLNTQGSKEMSNLLGAMNAFESPKPVGLVMEVQRLATDKSSTVLDYFAGSGTTGHAAINLNREDNGNRKYILVEQGAYFNSVLKPRIQKVIYSENWKNGKPLLKDKKSINPHGGVSQCVKYMKLESYEDTLNNLELSHSGEQQQLLSQHPDVKEDYLLNYMLDVEAKGSLLRIDAFAQPFDYQLNIATDSAGETRKQTVDLVETFNYLLGLRVHTQRKDTLQVICKQDEHGVWQRDATSGKPSGKAQEGESDCYTFVSIDGTMPDGKSALLVWRILNNFDEPVSKTCHNIALDYFLMERKRVNPREAELDVIYVNGDNTLPNIRLEDEHWKVRLIEEEFQRLMFAEDM